MRRLVFGALVASCSSLEIHGGRTVRAGDEPKGARLGTWHTADCRDPAGGAVEQRSKVVLIRGKRDMPRLLELRLDYDTVVIDNAFLDGRELVFQVTFSEGGPIALREMRLSADLKGPGKLVVTRAFSETDPVDGRFRAAYRNAAFTCRLDPEP